MANFYKDDLIDFTPAMRAEAIEVLKRYRVGNSPFTPALVGNVNGILGAIGAGTATNWPGSSGDPELHVVYAQGAHSVSSRSVATSRTEPAAASTRTAMGSGVAKVGIGFLLRYGC